MFPGNSSFLSWTQPNRLACSLSILVLPANSQSANPRHLLIVSSLDQHSIGRCARLSDRTKATVERFSNRGALSGGVQGGFFSRKKPLERLLSVCGNRRTVLLE